VLPLTAGIGDGAVQLMSTLGSAVISELDSIGVALIQAPAALAPPTDGACEGERCRPHPGTRRTRASHARGRLRFARRPATPGAATQPAPQPAGRDDDAPRSSSAQAAAAHHR
jgi:hypothetical protein